MKRFFAPFDVFIFGISLHSYVPVRRQNHDHVATSRRGCCSIERAPSSRQRVVSVGPAHARGAASRAPEHDRDLDLGPLAEKAHDVPLLGLVVMDADLGSDLDLLDLNLELVLPGLLGTLLPARSGTSSSPSLVPRADPHRPRPRRGRGPCRTRTRAPPSCEDSDLPALLVHQTDALCADLLVDSLVPLAREPAGRDPAYGGEVSKGPSSSSQLPPCKRHEPLHAAARHLVQPLG